MSRYYVRYVEATRPYLKYFKTEKEARKFFEKVQKSQTQEDWADYIIKGDLIEADDYYKPQIERQEQNERQIAKSKQVRK